MPNTDIPLVHSEEVKLFATMLNELDGDIHSLLESARMPQDILSNQSLDALVPESALKAVFQSLGERASPEKFALLTWTLCHDIYVPRFANQITLTHSLKAALEEVSQLLKQISDNVSISVQSRGGKWWLVREKQNAEKEWFRYAEMFSAMFMNELLKRLVGSKWKLAEVGIQDVEAEPFNQLPGMKSAQFFTGRPVTAISIPNEWINKPIAYIPSQTVLDKGSRGDDDKFSNALARALTPYLSMGKISIQFAGELIDMNARTIQRRLASESTSYREVIESLVLKQTLELLADRDLSITHIALKTGYSDSAHFTRAFKRMMKMTPKAYRQSLS
ncbi:helix-turn-helix transcriptional regulator [Vibrio hyugaensis]|uniref:helix-turn-helix transcriptional regulator n=1 Tax=Vibrio hyugaensis TaxID=1534743 RepID=UPI000CE334FD|nr:helix-turn-helix transcriptional regulator [Vibrio hyugaensis]